MARLNNNSNEKTERNKNIYKDRESGFMVVELSKKYELSIPRVHRICMQEENKVLKKENEMLKECLGQCEQQLNSCILKKQSLIL